MYSISAENVDIAARQVHIRLEDMTRIKASRKWWILPYIKRSDLPQSIDALISAFEATVVGYDISRDISALMRCIG